LVAGAATLAQVSRRPALVLIKSVVDLSNFPHVFHLPTSLYVRSSTSSGKLGVFAGALRSL
jgi:hypothetical protein